MPPTASQSQARLGWAGRVVGIFRLSADKEESTNAIEKINHGEATSVRSDAILVAHLVKVSEYPSTPLITLSTHEYLSLSPEP